MFGRHIYIPGYKSESIRLSTRLFQKQAHVVLVLCLSHQLFKWAAGTWISCCEVLQLFCGPARASRTPQVSRASLAPCISRASLAPCTS